MVLSRETKEKLIKEFGKSPENSGAIEVQVALLTENIRLLTDHCKENPKDFSTRRGLLKMVCRRRRYLDYLSRKDNQMYKSVVKRLGLKR